MLRHLLFWKQFLTRTAWWVVPLVWLPVATWFVLGSVNMGLTPTELAATFLTGFFGWTLMEYTLHRFFFHRKLKGYWLVFFLKTSIFCTHLHSTLLDYSNLYRGNTFHYLLHGCHHKHPMDSLRLVFPPAGAAILASIASYYLTTLVFYNTEGRERGLNLNSFQHWR